jgi:Peptidase family M28
MKKLYFFLFLFCINKISIGQITDVEASKFAKTITESDLKKHLYYIAGPECEGRGTGTPGIAKAASYIESQFKKYGLLPGNGNSYQIEYTLLQDSIMDSYITINGKQYAYNDFFTGNNRNNNNQQLVTSEIVYAGFGLDDNTYNDYKNINVKGKIVLIEEGEPKTNDTTYLLTGTKKPSEWSSFTYDKKMDAAIKNGAIAMFVIPKKFTKSTIWPQKRGNQYPAFSLKKGGLNRYFISPELTNIIHDNTTLEKGKTYTNDIAISFNKKIFETPSTNVIALMPGTDKKDEYVFITAHMDHLGKRENVIYYGADDDGSGTCAVMEMAEAFAKAKKKGNAPRRSIVFMTVSGEEKGLWGSEYYAKNPVFDLNKTTVDLNIDMIGRVGSDYIKGAPDSLNYVYVIGDDKLSSDLRPINEAANKNIGLKLDYRYNDPNDKNRFYYRSDHYNFAEKGVPIIFYFDGVHKDYHQPSDTPDKINYDLYAKRTKLVFHTAWLMANRIDMLKRDIPLVK